MKIRAIYKASKEFKEEYLKVKHFYEDENHLKNLHVSEEEKQKEIEEYNRSKQIYQLEDLYIAVLDEDSPDRRYQKGDLLLFSNSQTIVNNCLVICQYRDELLLARYWEDENDDDNWTITPLSEKYPENFCSDKSDLKIFGMVLHLHRMSEE